MIKRGIFLLLVIVFFAYIPKAQPNLGSSLDNLHPVTPTTFQFQKYTDLPVSEYTGIPNISIPIYTISEDGVNLPLTLSYHANGLRINQEASWVGLGWDLQIGSVIQTINDKDDYGVIQPSNDPYIKMKPDFNGNVLAYEYPLKWNYPFLVCQYGCNPPIGINSPTNQHGFVIYTDLYAPVNGYYERYSQMFLDDNYDSEPDVFTASFLDHSIKFIRSTNPDQIVVLNKKGYLVQRINGNWKITVPSGDEFYFEDKNNSESVSYSQIVNQGQEIGGPWDLSTITWLLTKIITKNKKQILINYSHTSLTNLFPVRNDRFIKQTFETYSQLNPVGYYGRGFMNGYPASGVLKTITHSREQFAYISSITFPKGQINFVVSNRNDLENSKKLDRIEIQNNQLLRTFIFNYDYWDASSIGGNGYPAPTGSISTHRLKLLSLTGPDGGVFSFFYNSNGLPKKNSFATDYWGFYNGQINNTSLAPNPAQFNRPDIGNNGDNHSANLTYAKAATLESIRYPTGGKVEFEFELNEFDNYWVPDFSSSNNTISKGNGLRVKSITHKVDGNEISKRSNYTYSGGKDILTRSMIRSYPFTGLSLTSFPNYIDVNNYGIDEVNSQGFFTPSVCGSIVGVGYNQVIRLDVDNNNQPNGSTETNFHNNPDIATNSANSTTRCSAVLPSFKNIAYPENGSIQSIVYKDIQNVVVKRVENSYINIVSPYFYGARIFSYGDFTYYTGPPAQEIITAQYLVGYYPVFDIETQLQNTSITEYSNGNSIVTLTSYSYDGLSRISSTSIVNSDGSTHGEIYDYPHPLVNPIQALLHSRNRLTEIVGYRKTVYSNTHNGDVYRYNHDYAEFADKILPIKTTITEHVHPFNNKPTEIFYDQYDALGNLIQYTKHNSITCLYWDYNNQYVTAEVSNSPNIHQTAFTSFEAENTGNWVYTGVPLNDPTAPTGKKVYALASGSITKSGLAPSGAPAYYVSYWSKNGAQNVNSVLATAGRQVGDWQYFEHKVIDPSAGIITISGTGTIDELRLVMDKAFMTTYTYQPLTGITSKCDQNNRITYYEYDGAGRLILIRDQDHKVIQKLCYNYAGQVENCNTPCGYSGPDWQNTGQTRCQQGTCGNTGYQEIEQIDINPCSSTYHGPPTNGAPRWILGTYNPSSCQPTNGVSITYNNSLPPNWGVGFEATYIDRVTNQQYGPYPIQLGTGILACLPAGSYTLSILKPTGNNWYVTFGTGCGIQSGTFAYFGKVSVGPCSSIILDPGVE